jgi:ABC-type glycerol-3-phosphate transport system permease component
MDKSLSYKKNALFFQIFVTVLSVLFLLLAFIPIILMFTLSLKSNVQIYGNFWSLPWPIQWSNYRVAVDTLIPNMVNSMVLVTVSTFFTVLLSSTSGYVFARLQFPGKNLLFYLILSLMMVPGILTLTPLYKLMQDLHLTNNWLALIFPWVSGGQVFGILLCRTFLSNQPAALFESARMDGATELAAYYKIALPLAKPILATLAIMNLMGFYNDFIWPLMVIDNNSRQVITVAIRVFQSMTGSIDLGSMVAGFVFSSIPLLILFMFGSRLYIEGVTSGAIKT